MAATACATSDDVVSMLDVLQEDAVLEDEANAVLGASDDKQCTYNEGYVKRQALYACATCSEGKDTVAGICLACSLHCHDDHNLFELYTKRNFQCDCGNSKFSVSKCTLIPVKDAVNPSNKYNDNFKGLYCTCKRPYPDPDAEEEEEMIQCIVCEDWYHSHHLKGTIPDCEDYHEMVCHLCMDSLPFLYAYLNPLRLNALIAAADKRENAKPDGRNTSQNETKVESLLKEDDRVDVETVDEVLAAKRPRLDDRDVREKRDIESTGMSDSTVENGGDVPRVGSQKPSCKLSFHWTTVGEQKLGQAAFFDEGWRCTLCRCTECKGLYEKHGLGFLFDEDDPVAVYESRGKLSSETSSTLDRGIQALEGSLNRTQQVEMLTHFNDLKTELNQYLRQFADENKVVTTEDIQEFFQHMEQRRRERAASGVPPRYCGK